MMAANMGGSRMSCLKLYWPQTVSLYHPEADVDLCGPDEEKASVRLVSPGCDDMNVADWDQATDEADMPVVLQFPRIAGRIGVGKQVDSLTRARLIRLNRCCPDCGRAAVVPIDAEPILMSRNRMPIPGSGRLAGFECDSCGHAWGIDE
jgi:hypothetical protein